MIAWCVPLLYRTSPGPSLTRPQRRRRRLNEVRWLEGPRCRLQLVLGTDDRGGSKTRNAQSSTAIRVDGLARASDSAQLALRCGCSNVMFVARAVWPSP